MTDNRNEVPLVALDQSSLVQQSDGNFIEDDNTQAKLVSDNENARSDDQIDKQSTTSPLKAFEPFDSRGNQASVSQSVVHMLSEEPEMNDSIYITAEDQLLNLIKDKHAENNLRRHADDTAKQYLDKQMYSIPLNELYEIQASCHETQEGNFCAVLIKVVDQKIQKLHPMESYLLQVWSKKGNMVFEKALQQPVCNWTITSDKFLFQEEPTSSEIFVIQLYLDKSPFIYKFTYPKHVTEGRVNTVFNPELGRFEIPEEKIMPRKLDDEDDAEELEDCKDIDSDVDHRAFAQIPIKPDQVFVQPYKLTSNPSSSLNNNSSVAPHPTVTNEQPSAPISTLFKDKIINRAPDKMLAYIKGFIILAYRDQFVYFNVGEIHGVDGGKVNESEFEKCVAIPDSELSYMSLDSSYKIISLQNIGNGQTCAIIESIGSRSVRFLQIGVQAENFDRRLTLTQLGIFFGEKKDKKASSPLLKFRGVAKFDKINNENYYVGLVLRQDGSVEVYSDFVLVDTINNPKEQCVDIETDDKKFYFKLVLDSDKVNSDKMEVADLKFKILRCKHTWRNRISMHTCKEKTCKTGKQIEKWDLVVHKRLANYVRLYSQIINFSTYMIVAHRDMISIFDMRNERMTLNQWVDTIKMPGHIRNMFIQKKPKLIRMEEESKLDHQTSFHNLAPGPQAAPAHMAAASLANRKNSIVVNKTNKKRMLDDEFSKFEILCLVNTNQIVYTEMVRLHDTSGLYGGEKRQKRLPPIRLERKLVKLSNKRGRVLSLVNDKHYKFGAMMISDNNVKNTITFKEVLNCKLYQFPLARSEIDTSVVFLDCIKMRQTYELMDSKDKPGLGYLNATSVCCILKANRELFEIEEDQFHQDNSDDDEDQVKQLYGDSESVMVLSCTNSETGISKQFPIVKERNSGSKVISNIYLIEDEGNCRQLQTLADEGCGRLLQNFFVTEKEFGDNNDCYTEIRENRIAIFDKQRNLQKTFHGLNLRNAVNIDQSYIYAANDSIDTTFQLMTDHSSGEGQEQVLQQNSKTSPEGIYVYNLAAMFEGRIEKYKLASGIGGLSTLIDHNQYSDRLSFIQSFHNLVVIPLPHLNIVNCIGMKNKHNYAVWREKNGFFTALDKMGDLITWSLLTGKLLYTIRQDGCETNYESCKDYDVQRADSSDITYTRAFYNFSDHSLNLLRSKEPVDQIADRLDSFGCPINKHVLEKCLTKQSARNEQGLDQFTGKGQRLSNRLFQPNNERAKISVTNSEIQSDYYHFKVLQLRTFEDTEKLPDCRIKFHFLFPLIRKRPQLVDQDLGGVSKWDITANPVQHLYLSRNTKRMMVVFNGIFATVYKRVNISDSGKSIKILRPNLNSDSSPAGDCGQQVKWKVEFHIQRYPHMLTKETSVPYIFSPNFTYQLDYLFREKQIVVRDTMTQEIYLTLPHDLISCSFNGISGSYGVVMTFSKICWYAERQIRIITNQNIDCIMEMRSTDPLDLDPKQRYLKMISVSKFDNLHTNMYKLNSVHLHHQPFTLQPRDVLERLIRVSQSYKTSLQHAINLADKSFNLLSKINKIDYLQPWGHLNSSFPVEKSFTVLDWLIMEQSIQTANFDLRLVDAEQKIQLCFNIFPNGRGILHHLAASESLQTDGKTKQDTSHAYFPIKDLFDVAQEETQVYLTVLDGEPTTFEIPILHDIYGQTALDICLEEMYSGKLQNQSSSSEIFETRTIAEKKNYNQDLLLVDLILESITDYGHLHSSLQIVDPLIQATKNNLPAAKIYLESRMKKVEHSLLTSSQREIMPKYLRKSKSMGYYGAIFRPIFSPVSSITSELFNQKTPLRPMNLLELDIPQFHKRTPEGDDFMYALSRCQDIEFFSLKSVQILIDSHIKYWSRINYIAIGLPLILQLMVFWYWSNVVLPHIDIGKETFKQQNYACVCFLAVTSFYQFGLELSAVLKRPRGYFEYPMTKIFNLLAPSLIVANAFRSNYQDKSFWRVQSWAALFVWMRFLLWLRGVSKFSWLIRLVTECFFDMKVFLIVFVMGVFAFADAFQSIYQTMILRGDLEPKQFNNEDDLYTKYFQSFVMTWQKSFLVALGEFGESNIDSYNETEFFIFFICCIFNLILLLNLLISLISSTYERISSVSGQTSYREKTYLVVQMQDYIFGFFGRYQADPCEMLFIAQEISLEQVKDDEEEWTDYISGQIDDLQDQMQQTNEEMKSFMNESLHRLSVFFVESLASRADGIKPAPLPPMSSIIESSRPAPEMKQRKKESSKRSAFIQNTKGSASQNLDQVQSSKRPQSLAMGMFFNKESSQSKQMPMQQKFVAPAMAQISEEVHMMPAPKQRDLVTEIRSKKKKGR